MKHGAANAKIDKVRYTHTVLVRAKLRLPRSGVVHPLSSISEYPSRTRDRTEQRSRSTDVRRSFTSQHQRPVVTLIQHHP